MSIQSYYQKALKFAALKHAAQNQVIPGTNLPYVVHLSNVAMEIMIAAQNSSRFNGEFAVQVALLHDTIEDTQATPDEIASVFDPSIAAAVSALTKNDALPTSEKMIDSINRIKCLQKEVWAVKLADRITNLQQPPDSWNQEKIKQYQKEAIVILEHLKGGNVYLEKRLETKITEYETYFL